MTYLNRGRPIFGGIGRPPEPAPEPVTAVTGLPVAAPAPEGVTDDLRATETWAAGDTVLYRNGLAVGTLDSADIAEWVAEACETLAEMEAAQAVWMASDEAPNCAMVDIGGEQMRMQGGADMPEPQRNAVADVFRAARQAMAEAKAAERAEIERQVREEIAAQIEVADADPNSEYERGLTEAARIARGER